MPTTTANTRRVSLSLIALLALAGCDSSYNSGTEPSTTRHAVQTTPTTDRAADTCRAMRDASMAASAVFYANAVPNRFPVTFTDMTTTNPPELAPPNDAVVAATTITGDGWTLTMTGGGATRPTYTCTPSV
jgi:hypothetical protein